jgi:peptidoglycan/LPS O-acetylase OafA/YrhL
LPWPAIAGAALVLIAGTIELGHPMLATFGLAALVVALASNQPMPVAAVLATPSMQWLGRISYSLYMVHLLIVETVGALVLPHTPYLYKEPARVLGAYAGLTILCLVSAAVMNRHVEEPARARVRRWTINRRCAA